jgi:hypothetical protein
MWSVSTESPLPLDAIATSKVTIAAFFRCPHHIRIVFGNSLAGVAYSLVSRGVISVIGSRVHL